MKNIFAIFAIVLLLIGCSTTQVTKPRIEASIATPNNTWKFIKDLVLTTKPDKQGSYFIEKIGFYDGEEILFGIGYAPDLKIIGVTMTDRKGFTILAMFSEISGKYQKGILLEGDVLDGDDVNESAATDFAIDVLKGMNIKVMKGIEI